MITITIRSSTTASVSRNARSAVGRFDPTTASTASANAMSVAAGIAQPRGRPSRRRVHREVDQRGYGDPARGRDDRHGRVRGSAQRADHELALELQPGHEEEDRERPVGGPVLHVEGADLPVPERVVRRRPRRVRPDDGDGRGHQGDGAPDGLARRRSPRNVAPPVGLGQGVAGGDVTTSQRPRGRRRPDAARATGGVPTRLPGSPPRTLPTPTVDGRCRVST